MRIAVDAAPLVWPGQELSGRVDVLEGGPALRLTVRLALLEITEDLQVPGGLSLGAAVLAEGDLPGGTAFPFAIPVPEGTPPCLRGPNSGLMWVVEARVDRRGADVVERLPTWVGDPRLR